MKLFAMALALVALTASAGHGAESAVAKGTRLYNEGKYEQALKAFHVSRMRDLTREAYFAWGMSAYKLGKFESAALKFLEAARMYPLDGDLKALLGECYLKAGKPAKALVRLRETDKLPVKDRAAALLMWGAAANMTGYGEEALEKYMQARKIAPSMTFETSLGIGTALLILKRYDEAERELAEAVRLRPGDAEAVGNLGEVNIKLGKHADAEKILLNAARLDPGAGIHHYNLACVYALTGRTQEACGALSKAAKMGFSAIQYAGADPDLQSLKDEECFRNISGRGEQAGKRDAKPVKKKSEGRRTGAPEAPEPEL
ncbi:MAG: tetratricopeptide repeat protein [Nitrospinae bacterium]|nr:tetratricopeptide repeat protein [Nitrospinota bacterium]